VKHIGVFRILTLVVILALLVMSIPANLCFADTGDEEISVSPTSGDIGDDIDIDGEGFEEDEDVDFCFSSDSISVGGDVDNLDAYEWVDSDTADDDGYVSGSFDVPDELTEGDYADEDVEDGTYYVYAVYSGDDEIVAKDTFSVSADGGTGNERINLLTSSGTIGDYVEFEGTHFEDDSTVDIYFSHESASVGDEIDSDVENYENVDEVDADSTGDISGSFYIPDELTDGEDDEDVESGTYYVYATYDDDDEIVARDTLSVIATEVSISPKSGVVGTKVTVTGSGFDDNRDITIKFGTSTVAIDSGDEDTSSSGAFTSSILVPESAKGSYTITIIVGSDTTTANNKFTVEPKIVLSLTSGGVGDSVTVTGTGFTKNKDVDITFDGTEVGTGDTGSNGSFEATFKVPEVAPGTYEVKADTAEANFKISTSVSISPVTSEASPGYVGMEVTISGTGFKSNSEITITYESEPVTFTTNSGADGSFTYTLTIPPSEYGEHTITASDGTSSTSKTFTMESTPPETPAPLLPYMGDKAGSKAHFDWEDVTEDINGADEKSTPITYELQIATDANFTDILLDKKGIATSEYTLTEEEKLESPEDEVPYYWRERAVDAASNASAWTGAAEFYIGFTFGIPELKGWVLYVLIAVGAILVFFLGLLVGRRRGGGEYY
jgi:hypothetical protein